MNASRFLDRQRRAGRREANLRLLNERIAVAHDRLDPDGRYTFEIACECAREGCDEMITIDVDAFRALQDDTERFVVVSGHVVADVEHVVEDHGTWQVVEKRGPAADEAARTLQ